jgi:hypothetical protein
MIVNYGIQEMGIYENGYPRRSRDNNISNFPLNFD